MCNIQKLKCINFIRFLCKFNKVVQLFLNLDSILSNKEYKSIMVMKVRYFLLLQFFLSVVLWSSCSKVEAPEAPVIEEKEKTILIYMSANNNLYMDAANNISKIINGYIPEDENLLIYSIPLDLETKAILDTLPVLMQVKYDEGHNVVVDTLYKFPYQNSSTKTALSRALNITKTLCPAKEYGLVLWSHGTGWLPPLYTTSGGSSSSEVNMIMNEKRRIDPYAHLVKSFGNELDTEMSIFDLQTAIPTDMYFDFIAFDACLMGGVEILYELRNNCNYMIFSPAEILTDSFDYSTVVEDFFKADYAKAAYDIYNYYNNLSGIYRSVTIATFKTDGVELLAEKAAEIFNLYRDQIQSLDLDNIQPYYRYNAHWYYDLNDFIKNLAPASQASEFEIILNSLCVAKYTTGQLLDLDIDPLKFSGISCYINSPTNTELDTYYKKYGWEKVVNMTLATGGDDDDSDDDSGDSGDGD